MIARSSKRRPGRPPSESPDDVRRRLLDAARALFIEAGFDGVSTKRIAERAGVNAAMINYYFGSKEGLGRAMMLDAMSPLLARLDAAAAQSAPVDLPDFLEGYMRTLAANPWLPRLVVREVLPSNGRLRALFLDELTARAQGLLPGLLERARAADKARRELDPRMVLLSMMSLAIFPFLAAPVVQSILEVDLSDEAFVSALVAHTVDVLENGIAPVVRS